MESPLSCGPWVAVIKNRLKVVYNTCTDEGKHILNNIYSNPEVNPDAEVNQEVQN